MERSRLQLWLGALALCALLGGRPAVAETAEPLVSVNWVKAHLADPDLVVLDIRSAIDGGGAEAYRHGHIPGALHSDYDRDGWRATRNGIPFMLPTVAQLEKLIGELGIDEDSRVVVVPAGVNVTDFGAAARVYWTLKVAGLTRVSILDGGEAAWAAAGSPVEDKVNVPSPRIFTATIDRSLIAEAADVEKLLASGHGGLVDARAAPLFSGKTKADIVPAYGHIPHAINVDSDVFYDNATNRLKPKAALAVLARKLVPKGPVITYCNTGHWSATDWFVLTELLGRKNVRVYYGSMADWAADPRRPVASSRIKWDDVKKFFGRGS